MEIIKTESFELAVTVKGLMESDRMILCLPGRLDTKDYAHIQSHLEYFAQRGYLSVSFDPPGTWESGGDTSLYTTTNYLTAISEIISHFDTKSTVVLGHSRGGTMAILAGLNIEFVSHIIAVMSHWGPSERPETEESTYVSYRDLPPGTERTIEQKTFELPMSYFDDHMDYSGLNTCNKPKLFFAGTRDLLVTTEDIKETYNLVEEPKQYIELESEHDYRLQAEVIDEVNNKVENFLRKY